MEKVELLQKRMRQMDFDAWGIQTGPFAVLSAHFVKKQLGLLHLHTGKPFLITPGKWGLAMLSIGDWRRERRLDTAHCRWACGAADISYDWPTGLRMRHTDVGTNLARCHTQCRRC